MKGSILRVKQNIKYTNQTSDLFWLVLSVAAAAVQWKSALALVVCLYLLEREGGRVMDWRSQETGDRREERGRHQTREEGKRSGDEEREEGGRAPDVTSATATPKGPPGHGNFSHLHPTAPPTTHTHTYTHTHTHTHPLCSNQSLHRPRTSWREPGSPTRFPDRVTLSDSAFYILCLVIFSFPPSSLLRLCLFVLLLLPRRWLWCSSFVSSNVQTFVLLHHFSSQICTPVHWIEMKQWERI